MGKPLRRLLAVAVAVAALGVPAYYALVLHSPAGGAEFPLEIARVRALAAAIPGPRATDVRLERVMQMTFAGAMVMAGAAWRATPMPVYSYQLVFPDQTVIVDTAVDRLNGPPEFIVDQFDGAAFDRMTTAMERAAQIVVTHEHNDHIGGIAAHPRFAQLLPALRLTVEQVGNPGGMWPAKLPQDAMAAYRPLQYDTLLPIAPGVVLIKAPGHTPGSQMVYVKRADDRELLFLGDVSWRQENIDLVRERPWFMTLLIGEDRHAVLAQFKTLRALGQREPGIALVPGHDVLAVQRLLDAGLLAAGFRLP
jgi:glyoxylase-like metal-dependent hydrolase (beta-lactamase superfamily II)